MSIDDLILIVLLSWIIPLIRFVFYQVTTPVPGARWLRKLVRIRSLTPITRMLLAQKVGLIFTVGFIGLVRFTGGFPGREWVAFALYLTLVVLAWVVHIYQRHLQLPGERAIRNQ
ncbi:hypothetical protein [Microbacterium sp. TPD7012]|uniref:hypothetical protein n=1 Tax=Microbacterium sp. TPD7012 TaxID=2171975 RepID=UPI000D51ECD3|nr:hypothetical protein [Microbacterium sp. TPD7012]PVE94983.1 hypothetical protein DC434_13745 [Microbacterium sp. TPD7012]